MGLSMAYRSKDTKLKTFGASYAIGFVIVYSRVSQAQDGFIVSLIFGFILGLFVYLFFGWIIGYFIQKEEDNKNQKKYEMESRQQREWEESDRKNNDRYRMDLEMERKRRELELEFEHYYRVAMLNAQIDEGKMRRLEQMKKEFAQEQTHGIDSLNSQIARLRKMAYED